MAKIHNQKLLEDNVHRCDTLGAGVIERRNLVETVRTQIIIDQREAVMDYIFGKSDENPLAESSTILQADREEYQARCAEMTAQVLRSTNKVTKK